MDCFSEVTEKEKGDWINAIEDEMKSFREKEVWTLTELPAGKRATDCKWIFNTKINAFGNKNKCKACLVSRGFTQRYEENFCSSNESNYFPYTLVYSSCAKFKIQIR